MGEAAGAVVEEAPAPAAEAPEVTVQVGSSAAVERVPHAIKRRPETS